MADPRGRGTNLDERLRLAAQAIRGADALLIGAGAGMGVDSGLPDFRGNEGFWKAYPPFRGKAFAQMSNPEWFERDPQLAWGFFGHRHDLYSRTKPHDGFGLLLKWGEACPDGYFVFTSNVDGQFQKAGFPEDRVNECHGSIHFLQCSRGCHEGIWPAEEVKLTIDPSTFRTNSPLPECPECGEVARPNILMFGDGDWLSDRQSEQGRRFNKWVRKIVGKKIVAIEMGAGVAIPTVRRICESMGDPHIRINPQDFEAGWGAISLPLGAMEGLKRIDEWWQKGG